MKKIISINQPRVFTLIDAHWLLPVIYRITEESHLLVRSLLNRMESVKTVNPVLAAELEMEIDREVHRWEVKIEKLGATPKGLWLADFDNGEGYYCWKFPETEIKYWHAYNEGFTGRKQINQPDTSPENFESL